MVRGKVAIVIFFMVILLSKLTHLVLKVGDEVAREKVGAALRDFITGKNPNKYKAKTRRRDSDPPRQHYSSLHPQRTMSLPISQTAKVDARCETPTSAQIHGPPKRKHASTVVAAGAPTQASRAVASATRPTTPTPDDIFSGEFTPDDIVQEKDAPDDFYEYCFGKGSNSS